MVSGEERLVERGAEILADGLQLRVARLAGQAVGIVRGVVEGVSLARLVHLAGGTVDGLLLCGIDLAEAVGQALHLLVHLLDALRLHEEQVAVADDIRALHFIPGFPDVQVRKHLFRGSLDIRCLYQALDELDDNMSHARQHMLRTYKIIRQVAQRRQRLQVTHQAVVEVNHLRVLDLRGFEGPPELIHIHAPPLGTLVVEHGASGGQRLLVVVVLGVEAGAVAIEHHDIVLRRSRLGNPVQLLGQVLLTVELVLRLLLEAGLGAQLREVGLRRQFKAHHLVLVGILAREGEFLSAVPVLIEEQHAQFLLLIQQRLRRFKYTLNNLVHVTAGMAVDEQRVVCQVSCRSPVVLIVILVAARCEYHCTA